MSTDTSHPTPCVTCGACATVMIGMAARDRGTWWLCAKCWREGAHEIGETMAVRNVAVSNVRGR